MKVVCPVCFKVYMGVWHQGKGLSELRPRKHKASYAVHAKGGLLVSLTLYPANVVCPGSFKPAEIVEE